MIKLYYILFLRWSKIANNLPGRTDNEIKNYWNTYLRKKLLQMGIDPNTHKPRTDLNPLINLSQLLNSSHLTNLTMNSTTDPPNWDNALKLQAQATDQLVKFQLLQNLFQALKAPAIATSDALLIGSRNLCCPSSFVGYANQNPGFVPHVDPTESRSRAIRNQHLIDHSFHFTCDYCQGCIVSMDAWMD